MGILDTLVNIEFQKSPDGNGWIYYPNGWLGKGRIIIDKSVKENFYKYQKKTHIFAVLLFLYLVLFFSINTTSILTISAIVIVFYTHQYFVIKNLPKSSVKFNHKKAIAQKLSVFPNWLLYFMYINSILLLILGIFSPTYLNKPFAEIYEYFLLFTGFGLFGVIITFVIHKSKKNITSGSS